MEKISKNKIKLEEAKHKQLRNRTEWKTIIFLRKVLK